MTHMPFRSRRASIAGLLVIAALVAPLSACSRATPRSVTAFCTTLAEQKHQFLSTYDTSNQDPLQGLVTGLGSLGEIPVIFDRLDKVAPSDIEPDVAAVRDAFKQQIGSIGAWENQAKAPHSAKAMPPHVAARRPSRSSSSSA